MKVIILCGGLGTRIAEETDSKPKPMVLIDDKPILWHIMNSFARQGYNEFILALGYRSDVIKRWLIDLNDLSGSITVDTDTKAVEHLGSTESTSWKVTALETGLNTQTGSRIVQCINAFPDDQYIATYGDGLANVPIDELVTFHNAQSSLATVTAVRPPARFGYMQINENSVDHFGEKNQSDEGWINGGFFVLNREIAKYLKSDDEPFETGIISRLVEEKQLSAYKHYGFWQPMDTLREKKLLSEMIQRGETPWLI